MKRSRNTDKDAFNVWKSSGNCPDDPGCIGVAPGAASANVHDEPE